MTRIAFLAVLLTVGCAGSAPVLTDQADVGSWEEVISGLPGPDYLPEFLTLEASVSVSERGKSSSFQTRISWRQNDSLYVSIRAPLGIEVGRVLLTSDSVYALDRIQKTLYVGDKYAAQSILPGFFGSLSDAPSALGLDPPSIGEGWTQTENKDLIHLERTDGRQTVLIDPAQGRVVARDFRDAAGTVVEQRRYSSFDDFEGRLLPRRTILIRPGDDLRASMYIRRMDLSPDRPTFDIDAPPRVTRVPIY